MARRRTITLSLPSGCSDEWYYKIAKLQAAIVDLFDGAWVDMDASGDIAKAHEDIMNSGGWANKRGPGGTSWPSLREVEATWNPVRRLMDRPTPSAR